MTEDEVMRKYAEAHGCGYIEIPIREIPGGGMISKRVYIPVRPLPCDRDEYGGIKKQTVKRLLAKIDEELNELKEAVFRSEEYDNDLWEFSNSIHEFEKKPIAEEAADTITAITTLLEALGIDAEMRDEAQRRVNSRNRERGRL